MFDKVFKLCIEQLLKEKTICVQITWKTFSNNIKYKILKSKEYKIQKN